MFLLKTIGKITVFPLLLFMQFINLLCKVAVNLSSYVVGPVFIFTAGCDIFCLMKKSWRDVLILTMIILGIMLLFFLAAFLQVKLENAENSIRRFLRA